MFRTLKIVTVLLTLGVVLAGSQTVMADLTTYEIGPIEVIGVGLNPSLSQDEAWGQVYDIMIDIQNELPEGHEILDFEIDSAGMLQDGTFEIIFCVVIGYNCPPGPPQGGGGGF